MVERIDGKSCIGRRHFEVARALKAIPMGTTFNLCLIEPNHNGFGEQDLNTRRTLTLSSNFFETEHLFFPHILLSYFILPMILSSLNWTQG